MLILYIESSKVSVVSESRISVP